MTNDEQGRKTPRLIGTQTSRILREYQADRDALLAMLRLDVIATPTDTTPIEANAILSMKVGGIETRPPFVALDVGDPSLRLSLSKERAIHVVVVIQAALDDIDKHEREEATP